MKSADPKKVARQHMQHGVNRTKARQYYLHHRSQIKRRSKRRYHRVHNTGAFHRQQHHRQLHPGQHHRIRAATVSLSLPVWFPEINLCGAVLEVQDGFVRVVLENGRGSWLPYESFVDLAVFDREGDIDIFFAALDADMDLDPITVGE